LSTGDIFDQLVFFNTYHHDLTSSVDDEHTISVGVPGSNEAELVSDLLAVQ
jgi:hypothetical protein